MSKIIVTGGSGFIGTNLVEDLIKKNHEVINIDIKEPKNPFFLKNWVNIDILNFEKLSSFLVEFNPEFVVHLAARTDLNEKKSIHGYNANIEGVSNIVRIINNLPSVKRTIYASSRMVCNIDYIPQSFEDYCPPNLYGESKVIGEKIVKEMASHEYTIVRPTSIWGPYFEIPYKTFFDTIKKGYFFLPKGTNPQKSFGFVYNTVYQIQQLLFEKNSQLQKNYYLTDYPPINLKDWANSICDEFDKKTIYEIPFFLLKIISLIGDLFQKVGIKNPPLTSFRLNNLMTNMVYDTTDLEKICGKLPYSMKEGVKITVAWIKIKE